ncbi:MAG: ROK family protein [Steroidobacteraceae bacterium]
MDVANNTPPLLAAVEGGGTKFVCAVGRSPTHVLDRITIPTTDPATTLRGCVEFFLRMADQHGRIMALGIACFGPLQLRKDAPDHGCLQRTPKPGWSGANVVAPLREALQAAVTLDTDVGAAALAEWRLGAGRGLGSLAYVTVGTGIGGAVVPALQAQQRLMHAEMGHLLPRRHPLDTGFAGVCPFHGDCLEGLASGPAVRARWGCDLSALPADHAGRSIIAFYLGQLVASLALVQSVQRIVFGGGVMSDNSLLPLVRQAATGVLGGYLQPLREAATMDDYVTSTMLGQESAITGGLLMAQDWLTDSIRPAPAGRTQGA